MVIALSRAAKFPRPDKKAAPLFAPTTYAPVIRWNNDTAALYKGFRCRQNAELSALLVIDGDRGLQYQATVAKLREYGLEAVCHTTASNLTGENFHIIVPLSEPVAWAEQDQTVHAFCRFLDPEWRPDPTKLSADCLYYLPATYAGADNQFDHLPGDVLSAADWRELAPAPPRRSGPRAPATCGEWRTLVQRRGVVGRAPAGGARISRARTRDAAPQTFRLAGGDCAIGLQCRVFAG